MRRREFLAIPFATALLGALNANAQKRWPIVGILGSPTAESRASSIAAIRRALEEAGFVEGRNLTVEMRWANNEFDRLPALAAELVSRDVSVIIALGNVLPAHAAKAATATIPIVFSFGGDPVESEIVSNLRRPGGNICL